MKNIHILLFLLFPFFSMAQVTPDRLPYNYDPYPLRTEWNLAVFPIDFSDIPADARNQFPTREVWEDSIFNGLIAEYYRQISYGAFTLKGTVFDYTTSLEVFWDSASGSVTGGDAVLASVDIQAPGIDLESFDLVMFIICHDARIGQSVTRNHTFTLNGQQTSRFSVMTYFQYGAYNRRPDLYPVINKLVDKREFLIPTGTDSAVTAPVYHRFPDFQSTVAHELGHGLGIDEHANTSTNGGKAAHEPEITGNGNLLNRNYGNRFSLMGSRDYGMTMTGGYRDIVGFMDTSYIYSANWYGTSTATIHPLNRNEGKRYIEVLMPDQKNFTGYKNTGYGLELREVDDLDTLLSRPELSENTRGFFVHKIDGTENLLLDASPSPNISYYGEPLPDLRDVVLKPGMTYENDEVRFSNVEDNGDGSFSIDITIKTDLTVTPSVEFTKAQRLGDHGEILLEWTHDCGDCTPDQFLTIDYRHVDSTFWESLFDADLSSGIYTTSGWTGKKGPFEFRAVVSGSDTHTPSLYSRTIRSTEVSGTVGLEPDSGEPLFSVYPNPASRQISIRSESILTGTISVLDMNGRTLFQETIRDKNIYVLDPQLEAGSYILRFQGTGDAVPVNRRLLVR